jgi:hypothetical protein
MNMQRMMRVAAGVLALAVLGGRPVAAAGNSNSQFVHREINMFPAAAVAARGKLTIDGDLSDWKAEAFVQMCADPQMLDLYTLKIAFAWDDTGLLVAGRVKDPSPLVNHQDPAVSPDKGWEGDALQLRFITDPEFPRPMPAEKRDSDAVVHFTSWFFTDKQQPCLFVQRGMTYRDPQVLTGEASGMHYRAVEGGYAFEGRIPWTVFKKKPDPGTAWRCTLQPLWGDARGSIVHNFFDVITSAGFHFQTPDAWGRINVIAPDKAAAALAVQTASEAALYAPKSAQSGFTIDVNYSNPAAGYMSMAICNAKGQIVRTLLAKEKRDAGKQTEKWNGLDDDGKPVSAGTYSLRALTHPGITPKFIASVHNSGTPPWRTADDTGAWGADHGVPVDAKADAEGNVYLLWHICEGGSAVIKVGPDGKKLWGNPGGWMKEIGLCYTALAVDGGIVYAAKSGYGSWEREKKDRAEYNDGIIAFDAATGKRVNIDGKGIQVLSTWKPEISFRVDELGTQTERLHAGRFPGATLVDTGDIGNLVAMAFDRDSLFVSLYFENKVAVFDKKTFARTSTIDVPAPAGLAYDASRGIMYCVSGSDIVALRDGKVAATPVRGLDFPTGLSVDKDGNLYVSVRGRQMEVRRYSPEGKLLATIGKHGGRPWVGSFEPEGMLMPAGLAVTPQGQVWVAEADSSPKRVSVWNISTGKLDRDYFGPSAYAVMMAADPERQDEVYAHNCRFVVDYATGTWKVDSTVYRKHWLGETIGSFDYSNGFTWRMSSYKGKKLAYNGRCGLFYQDRDGTMKPFQYDGSWLEPLPKADTPALMEHAGPANTVWRDLNGNALPEKEEMTFAKGRNISNANIGAFGGDMYPGGVFILGKYNSPDRYLFRPLSADERGLPVYPAPNDAEPIFKANGEMAQFGFQQMIYPSFAPESGDYETFYGIAGKTDKGPLAGIYRFDRQGNIQWRYARVALGFGLTAPLTSTGDIFGALRIVGHAQLPEENGGEIIGIGSYRGYFVLLNQDGMFIDQVGHDNGRGPTPDFDANFVENFSGYLFRHAKSGKLFLFCGDSDGRILELQGWDKIRPFDAGTLTVSPKQVEDALLASQTDSSDDSAAPVRVAAMSPAPKNGVAAWEKALWSTIRMDETRTAKVALAYDSQNLYACFQVQDETPWKNTMQEWQRLFKTGDAVDIQIGVMNPATGKEKRANQKGDVRIFLAPSQTAGKATAVAMWNRVPDGMARQDYTYVSPTGEEKFERIALLEGIDTHVSLDGKGYAVTAAIPWKELGRPTPEAGTLLQGDVGVLSSDAGGNRTALRSYLFNKDTSITFDIPNEVRVVSANWGVLLFGKEGDK